MAGSALVWADLKLGCIWCKLCCAGSQLRLGWAGAGLCWVSAGLWFGLGWVCAGAFSFIVFNEMRETACAGLGCGWI